MKCLPRTRRFFLQWPNPSKRGIYGFDKRITSVSEVSDLDRGGRSSRLLMSLDEIGDRLEQKPVAGLLLMSDGNDAMALSTAESLPNFKFPIYPVIPDGNETGFDLRIVNTSVRQTNFEISPVTLTVRYRIDNQPSGGALARLTDIQSDTVVEEQKIDLSTVGNESNVTFQFRPTDVGLRFYRFDLFRDSDSDAFANIDSLIETPSSETTLMNNTQLIAVNRQRGPYRGALCVGAPELGVQVSQTSGQRRRRNRTARFDSNGEKETEVHFSRSRGLFNQSTVSRTWQRCRGGC